MNARRGFSLIEMLVVIGIIATLMGAAAMGFRGAVRRAQKARCEELVTQAATALTQMLQQDGSWPRSVIAAANAGGEMTPEVAIALAKRQVMSLAYDSDDKKMIGVDQFGVVSPWAQEAISRASRKGSASIMTKVPSGGTVADHRLRFAIDDDLNGLVNASPQGYDGSVVVRGSAVVWCCGMNGKFEGRRGDDVFSWSKGQEKE